MQHEKMKKKKERKFREAALVVPKCSLSMTLSQKLATNSL